MADTWLRTVMYHRVVDGPLRAAASPSLVSASPADFERQMRHLARRYRVVSADEVRASIRGERALPARAVLVTFDDAYTDFGNIAWPIMRRHGLPATVFVSTDYPGHPERSFWWDRLHHAVSRTRLTSVRTPSLGFLPLDGPTNRARSLRDVHDRLKGLSHESAAAALAELLDILGAESPASNMVHSWDELRSLSADGVTIGGHTRSHAALTRVSPAQLADEVRCCRKELREQIGADIFAFAYPYGFYDGSSVQAVQDAGFEMAFTCDEGHSRLTGAQALRLRRTNITTRTTPALFRLRLFRLGSVIDSRRQLVARQRRSRRGHDSTGS
jgi:peptidoglycan/xylan/chitin deacetylase (PgdA/CDA1 family)